ncbi:hypothetical protein ROZALSC1DRAFT_29456 [Rozella allomycis CSF55]|uniref:Uncharacterized protein n=1 Tax=Rozella allomycis (strain CSF55) TaxID=988480 RepID=A0A4P9YH99_ROZAC|nr:hypothetical protein ROZALSC1DRAFT_29456 [Rozella allomycis CSF55]
MSPNGSKFMSDLQKLLNDMEEVIKYKNDDEKLQQLIYHTRLAADAAMVEVGKTGQITFHTKRRRTIKVGGVTTKRSFFQRRKLSEQTRKDMSVIYKFLRLTMSSNEFRFILKDSRRIVSDLLREERKESEYIETGEEHESPTHQHSVQASRSGGVRTMETQSQRSATYGEMSRTERELREVHQKLHEHSKETENQRSQLPTPRSSVALEKLPIIKESSEEMSRPVQQEETTQRVVPRMRVDDYNLLKKLRRVLADLGKQPEFADTLESMFMVLRRLKTRQDLLFGRRHKSPQEQAADIVRLETGPSQEGVPTTESLPPKVHKKRKIPSFFKKRTKGHVSPLSETTPVIPPALRYDANLKQATLDLKSVIESFLGGLSLDNFIDVMGDLRLAVAKDYPLKDFFFDWQSFVDKCLREPSYMNTREYYERGRYLLDRGRSLKDDDTRGYRRLFERLRTEWNNLSDAYKADEISNKMIKDSSSMFNDVYSQIFDVSMLKDLRAGLLPVLLNQFKYIPVPRIEILDADYDLVIENLVLAMDNLLPKLLDVQATQHLHVERGAGIPSPEEWLQGSNITLGAIHMDLKNIQFFLRKKTGLVKLVDNGLVDFKMHGDGMVISMNVSKRPKREREMGTFVLQSIGCWIDRLDMKVHQSKHDYMYKVFGPFYKARIKNQICRAVEDQLTTAFDQFDKTFTRYRHGYKRRFKSTPRPRVGAEPPLTATSALAA